MDYLLNPVIAKFEGKLADLQCDIDMVLTQLTEIQTTLRRLSLLRDALPNPAPVCPCSSAPAEAHVGSDSGRPRGENTGMHLDSPVAQPSVSLGKRLATISL